MNSGLTMRLRDIDLLLYQGSAADVTGGGLNGAVQLAGVFERRLGIAPQRIGEHSLRTSANRPTGWQAHLDDVRHDFGCASQAWAKSLRAHRRIIGLLPRCSVAMATLPQVVKRHPRAKVLWIDAHADLNTPDDSPSGYLGGMALAAAIGRWDSGFGAGLAPGNTCLIGARDIDAEEHAYLDTQPIRQLDVTPNIGTEIAEWLGDAPVYIHLDCDVFDPATLPADYAVHGGIDFDGLARILTAVSADRLIGIEIAELAATWPDGRQAPTQRSVDVFTRLVQQR